MMPRHLRHFLFGVALVAGLNGALAASAAAPSATIDTENPVYNLAVPPLQLVTTEAEFAPFAHRVAADVEAALRHQPPPEAARLKLLLGLRVHLALHSRDDATALDAAARIRALQTDPAERAHAGLTTRALVAGKHEERAFEREFTRLLRSLPLDPATRAVLVRAREKIAATTESALLDEVRTTIAPRIAAGEPCTLEIADQLVRVRHRLEGILPLRDAMLRAYDSALSVTN